MDTLVEHGAQTARQRRGERLDREGQASGPTEPVAACKAGQGDVDAVRRRAGEHAGHDRLPPHQLPLEIGEVHESRPAASAATGG